MNIPKTRPQFAARQFGAEAWCNDRRSSMNRDDKYNVAFYAGKPWGKMPQGLRDECVKAFHEGVEAEKKAEKTAGRD
jgi:hypothetical protein